jgi:predicted esterase
LPPRPGHLTEPIVAIAFSFIRGGERMKTRGTEMLASVVALLCLAAPCRAQYGDINGEVIGGSFFLDTQEITYRLFVPAEYEPGGHFPIVVALHALAQWGDSTDSPYLAYNLGGTYTSASGRTIEPCFLLLPQCPAWNQWVDWDFTKGNYSTDSVAFAPELAAAKALADSIVAAYGIDTNRIYLAGLSMGAMGVWDLLARFPGKYAAALALSGSGDPSKTPLMTDVSIWAAHGTEDNEIPLDSATQEMILALSDAGAEVLFIEAYPYDPFGGLTEEEILGARHLYSEYWMCGHAEYWTKFLGDPTVMKWLFAQRREGSDGVVNAIVPAASWAAPPAYLRMLIPHDLMSGPQKRLFDCLGKTNTAAGSRSPRVSSGVYVAF